MNLKLVMAVSLCAVIPMVAYGQQNGPAANAPKPSTADVQKLVQSIGADQVKLKTYCDIGKLQIRWSRLSRRKIPRPLQLSVPRPTTSENNLAPTTKKLWPR